MSCGHIKEMLYDYTKGELSNSEMSEIEHHLPSCPDCRSELTSILSLKSAIKREYDNSLPPGLLRKIKKESGLLTFKERLFSPVPAFGFAALALAALFFIFMSSGPAEESNPMNEFLDDSYSITSGVVELPTHTVDYSVINTAYYPE